MFYAIYPRHEFSYNFNFKYSKFERGFKPWDKYIIFYSCYPKAVSYKFNFKNLRFNRFAKPSLITLKFC